MKKTIAFIITMAMSLSVGMTAFAAPKTMPDGTVFDPEFYAETYPDVKAAFGNDEAALYNHYVQYGKSEGRKATADDAAAPKAPGEDNWWKRNEGETRRTVSIDQKAMRLEGITKENITQRLASIPGETLLYDYSSSLSEPTPAETFLSKQGAICYLYEEFYDDHDRASGFITFKFFPDWASYETAVSYYTQPAQLVGYTEAMNKAKTYHDRDTSRVDGNTFSFSVPGLVAGDYILYPQQLLIVTAVPLTDDFPYEQYIQNIKAEKASLTKWHQDKIQQTGSCTCTAWAHMIIRGELDNATPWQREYKYSESVGYPIY